MTTAAPAYRHAGRPVWSSSGRRPSPAERPAVAPRRGVPRPRRQGPGPSLEQTLLAMKEALPGADGLASRDSVGDLSRAIAAAPVLGAGMGGLSPRDPVVSGVGSSVVAAGTTACLARSPRERDAALEGATPLSPQKATYPVQLVDVPPATVDAERAFATAALDPLSRERLLRAMRMRSTVLRGCYESWGLAVDARRRGRLVVELTLRPDGRVDDLQTTASDGVPLVGDCVRRAAVECYLGDGLVDAPTRLSFPLLLRPRS